MCKNNFAQCANHVATSSFDPADIEVSPVPLWCRFRIASVQMCPKGMETRLLLLVCIQ